MASVNRMQVRVWSLLGGVALLATACSPEARRVRDGGPGADPGNKRWVEAPTIDPRAADTTLWPGHAPPPVERLVAGTMPPPPTPKPPGVGPERR